jgi:hypothetical protein
MRSDLVVLTPELLDHNLRIDSISKPLHAQALVLELAVERFIIPVLPRLPRIDMRRVDVRLQQPAQYRPGDELGSIVGSQVPRATVNADQSAQYLDDPAGADAPGHVDRKALASELIDHGEALELLTISAGVEYKIIRPYLTHGRRRQWPRSRSRHTSARPFFRHLQLVQPPEPVSPISTHDVPSARQEHLDAPVAIPGVLRGELVHRRHRRRISLRQTRLVANSGSRHTQQRARSPYRSTSLAYVGDLLPANGRAHHL